VWATSEFQHFTVPPAARLNGADGISDIEGKATRVGASDRGQGASFNPLSLTAVSSSIFLSGPVDEVTWFRLAALELARNLFHRAGVSKVEQMELELRKLSQAELRQIREWLDDFIEDELEFTPEFQNSIQRSERDMAAEKAARVREPEGS
jgi:hypothetical protein